MKLDEIAEFPLNIAHRGARSIAPENTLAALEKAVAAGAHMWETDVQMSADGVPVIFHDETLERTTDIASRARYAARRPWRVSDFTAAELGELDFGAWYGRTDPFGQIGEGAVTSAAADAFRGERLFTLDAALAFTRETGFPVNVEIKTQGTPELGIAATEKVVEMIRSMDLVERVLISSFDHPCLVRVKEICPEIMTGALVEAVPADPVGMVLALGADAYHPHVRGVDPATIRGMGERGIAVNVYTVNDEADMKALRDAGASGIITDFPQRLGVLV